MTVEARYQVSTWTVTVRGLSEAVELRSGSHFEFSEDCGSSSRGERKTTSAAKMTDDGLRITDEK